MDGVGMFRYTTKIAEYLAVRLPVITNQVPMAYDLGADWMWRLPGGAPWDEIFLDALVKLVEGFELAIYLKFRQEFRKIFLNSERTTRSDE